MSETSQHNPNLEHNKAKAEAIAHAIKPDVDYFTNGIREYEGRLRDEIESGVPADKNEFHNMWGSAAEAVRAEALQGVQEANERQSARYIAKAEKLFDINPDLFTEMDTAEFQEELKTYESVLRNYHSTLQNRENAIGLNDYATDRGALKYELRPFHRDEMRQLILNLRDGFNSKDLTDQANLLHTMQASGKESDIMPTRETGVSPIVSAKKDLLNGIERAARWDHKVAVVEYNEFMYENADHDSEQWQAAKAYLETPEAQRVKSDITKREEAEKEMAKWRELEDKPAA